MHTSPTTERPTGNSEAKQRRDDRFTRLSDDSQRRVVRAKALAMTCHYDRPEVLDTALDRILADLA